MASYPVPREGAPGGPVRAAGNLLRRGLQATLRGYRYWISPLLGPRCRFEPSCSAYAIDALDKHALGHAMARILWRVIRCQPWCRGGYDPA